MRPLRDGERMKRWQLPSGAFASSRWIVRLAVASYVALVVVVYEFPYGEWVEPPWRSWIAHDRFGSVADWTTGGATAVAVAIAAAQLTDNRASAREARILEDGRAEDRLLQKIRDAFDHATRVRLSAARARIGRTAHRLTVTVTNDAPFALDEVTVRISLTGDEPQVTTLGLIPSGESRAVKRDVSASQVVHWSVTWSDAVGYRWTASDAESPTLVKVGDL